MQRSRRRSLRGLGRRPSNPDAELLGRPKLSPARLAFDGERGAEACPAGWTLGAQIAAALRARGRQLVHELLEVALHEPAAETNGDPVAERLAPFLLDPVPLGHSPESLTEQACLASRPSG